MGVLNFWVTIPRLMLKLLRVPGYNPHFIAVHFRPSDSAEQDPYAGSGAGNKVRTKLESELDYVQACLVADLDNVVEALVAVEELAQAGARRKTAKKTLENVLKSVGTGPSSVNTLSRNGRRYLLEREAQCEPKYRGYRTSAKAARFAAIGDAEALKRLIDGHVMAIRLIGRARWAAQTTAKGMRATLIQVFKNKRRKDQTISRDMLDRLPELSIMEMTCLAFVSGVNASHIWQSYHGAPWTIDYHRVFDLAVFAGRLSRGEPAPITWDLARYLELHRDDPNIERSWRQLLFPNTVDVHFALEWICARIDDVCSFDELREMIGRCNQPGQAGTLRLPPIMP